MTSVLPQPELQIAALEQRRQLPVAVAEVEDDGERVVLLACVTRKLSRKLLPLPVAPSTRCARRPGRAG